MPNIVQHDGDQLFTTSDIIASKAAVEHRAVLQIIGKYEDDLSEFGSIAFEMRSQNRGGHQVRIAKLNEQQSTLVLTYLRNTETVRVFKKDLVKAFFEMAQQLRSSSQSMSLQERTLGILGELSAEVEKEKQRADVAEDRIDTIEGGNGISVREFHKHYFSETPEREFNELLYRKGLLLDQRGQRVDDNGKSKPGKQHRHPSAKGKQFFELDPHIDKYTGARYYNVKVRPGKPETDLVDQLERWGLGSNKNRRRNMLQLESHHGMRAVS